MIYRTILPLNNFLSPLSRNSLETIIPMYFFSTELDNKYSEIQKEKILKVINDPDDSVLKRYDLTKARLKMLNQWRSKNGQVQTISDVESIKGFCQKSTVKLFNSILEKPKGEQNVSNKIKGQILQPVLSEAVRQSCKTVLAVYVSVNSVCWTLIDKEQYEVTEWKYYGIDYPESKRFQITNILDIAWKVTNQLPHADIYVMKAEATTLRAAGSDPNNPKVISVNLQKSQMVAMIVALINTRSHNNEESLSDNEEEIRNDTSLKHKVYFLRPTLPYRLYGTLVGNERVSTEQVVEMLLQRLNGKSSETSQANINDHLLTMFRSQKDLERDMLGHCLLLGLTFMDLCVYKNQEKIDKLLKRYE